MLTAYDYPSALCVEKSGVDTLLVGDSLAMVVLGHQSTTSITMDEMLHHCKAVSRGAKSPFLIGDMPFGSYQVSPQEAVRNAIRFIAEGNMEAVKLEGGREMLPAIKGILQAGVPVLGHIGLTPQKHVALGGYRVQGKTAQNAMSLYEDALALQDAGCFGLVIEAVPAQVAALIQERLSIPIIGIGAGPQTNGQVLVMHDMLGMFDRFVPKFNKQYANVEEVIVNSFRAYHEEVKQRAFPAPEHCYPMDNAELDKFAHRLSTITKPHQ